MDMNKKYEDMNQDEKIEYECSVIEACTGRDDNGAPRGTVSASIVRYHANENNPDDAFEALSSKNFLFPDFGIEVHGEFAQIDLHFPSGDERAESELASMWRYLDEYGSLAGGVKEAGDGKIFICFSVIPDGIGVARPAYLSFTNPIFRALTASKIRGGVDTIRLLVLTGGIAICNYPDLDELKNMEDGFARTQYLRDKG